MHKTCAPHSRFAVSGLSQVPRRECNFQECNFLLKDLNAKYVYNKEHQEEKRELKDFYIVDIHFYQMRHVKRMIIV